MFVEPVNALELARLLVLLQKWLTTRWKVKSLQQPADLFHSLEDSEDLSESSNQSLKRRSAALIIHLFLTKNESDLALSALEKWLRDKIMAHVRLQVLTEVFFSWRGAFGYSAKAQNHGEQYLVRNGWADFAQRIVLHAGLRERLFHSVLSRGHPVAPRVKGMPKSVRIQRIPMTSTSSQRVSRVLFHPTEELASDPNSAEKVPPYGPETETAIVALDDHSRLRFSDLANSSITPIKLNSSPNGHALGSSPLAAKLMFGERHSKLSRGIVFHSRADRTTGRNPPLDPSDKNWRHVLFGPAYPDSLTAGQHLRTKKGLGAIVLQSPLQPIQQLSSRFSKYLRRHSRGTAEQESGDSSRVRGRFLGIVGFQKGTKNSMAYQQALALVEVQFLYALAMQLRRLYRRTIYVKRHRLVVLMRYRRTLSRCLVTWCEARQERVLSAALDEPKIAVAQERIRWLKLRQSFCSLRSNVTLEGLRRRARDALRDKLYSMPMALKAAYLIYCRAYWSCFDAWKRLFHSRGTPVEKISSAAKFGVKLRCRLFWKRWICWLTNRRRNQLAGWYVRQTFQQLQDEPWHLQQHLAMLEREQRNGVGLERAGYSATINSLVFSSHARAIREHALHRALLVWRVWAGRLRMFCSVSDIRFSFLGEFGSSESNSSNRRKALIYRRRSSSVCLRPPSAATADRPPTLRLTNFCVMSPDSSAGSFRYIVPKSALRWGSTVCSRRWSDSMREIADDSSSLVAVKLMCLHPIDVTLRWKMLYTFDVNDILRNHHDTLANFQNSRETSRYFDRKKSASSHSDTPLPCRPPSICSGSFHRRNSVANGPDSAFSSHSPVEFLRLTSASVQLQLFRRWLKWKRGHRRLHLLAEALRRESDHKLVRGVWLYWRRCTGVAKWHSDASSRWTLRRWERRCALQLRLRVHLSQASMFAMKCLLARLIRGTQFLRRRKNVWRNSFRGQILKLGCFAAVRTETERSLDAAANDNTWVSSPVKILTRSKAHAIQPSVLRQRQSDVLNNLGKSPTRIMSSSIEATPDLVLSEAFLVQLKKHIWCARLLRRWRGNTKVALALRRTLRPVLQSKLLACLRWWLHYKHCQRARRRLKTCQRKHYWMRWKSARVFRVARRSFLRRWIQMLRGFVAAKRWLRYWSANCKQRLQAAWSRWKKIVLELALRETDLVSRHRENIMHRYFVEWRRSQLADSLRGETATRRVLRKLRYWAAARSKRRRKRRTVFAFVKLNRFFRQWKEFTRTRSLRKLCWRRGNVSAARWLRSVGFLQWFRSYSLRQQIRFALRFGERYHRERRYQMGLSALSQGSYMPPSSTRRATLERLEELVRSCRWTVAKGKQIRSHTQLQFQRRTIESLRTPRDLISEGKNTTSRRVHSWRQSVTTPHSKSIVGSPMARFGEIVAPLTLFPNSAGRPHTRPELSHRVARDIIVAARSSRFSHLATVLMSRYHVVNCLKLWVDFTSVRIQRRQPTTTRPRILRAVLRTSFQLFVSFASNNIQRRHTLLRRLTLANWGWVRDRLLWWVVQSRMCRHANQSFLTNFQKKYLHRWWQRTAARRYRRRLGSRGRRFREIKIKADSFYCLKIKTSSLPNAV